MHRQDDSRHPGWLQSRWDRQKRDTATRIEVAVTALQKDHVEMTYGEHLQTGGSSLRPFHLSEHDQEK